VVKGDPLFLKWRYNPAMPCEEYERLRQNWQEKTRAENAACMNGYGRSVKAGLEDRSRSTSERISAETLWMKHIEGCEVCQGEGRTSSDVYTRPPNY
jgi:hypothetical protein